MFAPQHINNNHIKPILKNSNHHQSTSNLLQLTEKLTEELVFYEDFIKDKEEVIDEKMYETEI